MRRANRVTSRFVRRSGVTFGSNSVAPCHYLSWPDRVPGWGAPACTRKNLRHSIPGRARKPEPAGPQGLPGRASAPWIRQGSKEHDMLSAQHLVKSFAGRRVIEDVTLSLERGEVVGLLGPNGAGKTTTFTMLTGMMAPDAGAITLDGHVITTMPFYDRARFGIAYLPQAPFVPRGLTVEENILLVLEARMARGRKERLAELIEEFRLEDLRKTRVGQLSGGQRRRCEIAITLACE